MNSKSSRTSVPHIILLNLTDKISLSNKYVALSNYNIHYTWKNIKESYKNNKFKISAQTWNEKFELFDWSCILGLDGSSVSDIKDYLEYIIKKHEKVTDDPPIRIYINKIENTITFRIKKEYCIEFLTPETMKLLGSTKSKMAKDVNGENVPHLEITEVV